jgi:hypothetical protein
VTAAKPGADRDDISGACQLDEHGYCHGNIDLQSGPGPAIPLLRCACSCHRDRIRIERQS